MAALRIAPCGMMRQPQLQAHRGEQVGRIILAVSNHLLSMRKPQNDVATTPEGPIAAQRVRQRSSLTECACSGSVASNMASQSII